MGHLDHNNNLVGWNFKPSQPPTIILSGLKTNLNLSPDYSAHKSSNHRFSQTYKNSPDTNVYKTKYTYTNIKHQIVEELVSSVLPLLKKKKCIRLNLVRAVITSACECFAMYAGGHTWA